MKQLLRLLVVGCLISSNGCYSMTHYVSNARSPVFLDNAYGEIERHFKEEDRYFYLLGGLIPVYQPKLEDKISSFLRRGVKIANLKIESQLSPVDYGINILGNIFFLGLISTRTVRYEGDLVYPEKVGGEHEVEN